VAFHGVKVGKKELSSRKTLLTEFIIWKRSG